MDNEATRNLHTEHTAKISRRGRAVSQEDITRKQNLLEAWSAPVLDIATTWVFEQNGVVIEMDSADREAARAYAYYLCNKSGVAVSYFRKNGMGLPLIVKAS